MWGRTSIENNTDFIERTLEQPLTDNPTLKPSSSDNCVKDRKDLEVARSLLQEMEKSLHIELLKASVCNCLLMKINLKKVMFLPFMIRK